MKNNMKNNIIFSLVFMSSVLLTILLFNFNERSELEHEALANKKYTDSIQNQFLAKNKELANMLKLLQKQKDTAHHAVNSVERIDGVSINNKPITLDQLIGIANSYMRENGSLRNKIKNDSLNIERYKIIIAHLEKAKVLEQD